MFTHDDAHATMTAMIFQTRILAQALKCAAEFSLADHLSAEPRSAAGVAAAAGLNQRAAQRLLRYCSAIGLATREADGSYRATPLLATLRSDDPLSLRSFALAQNGPGQWAVLGRLNDAFRTGQPQAEAALGCSLYEYYSQPQHVEEAAAYRRGLAGLNTILEAEFAKIVDTRSVSHVLDVGGSTGSMVLALMQANPALRGAVLDLPAVAEAAWAQARSRGLADRFEFAGGDFFTHVPASDMYILKNVLGNWPDDKCLQILRNCRDAARRGARLIIVENVLDDVEPGRWSVDIDLVTLVAVGGETRCLNDYKRLLAQTEFEFTKLRGIASFTSMIEAVRA